MAFRCITQVNTQYLDHKLYLRFPQSISLDEGSLEAIVPCVLLLLGLFWCGFLLLNYMHYLGYRCLSWTDWEKNILSCWCAVYWSWNTSCPIWKLGCTQGSSAKCQLVCDDSSNWLYSFYFIYFLLFGCGPMAHCHNDHRITWMSLGSLFNLLIISWKLQKAGN